MSVTMDWAVYVWDSGSTYTFDAYMYRPNKDLETTIVSNMQVIKLADGSEAYIQPENKYIRGNINMYFAETTSAYRSQIENYIINGEKVKIVTHDSQIIYGYFIDMNRVWFAGQESSFDIAVVFKQTVS